MGLAGGVAYPALTVFLAAWIPEKERSVLGSIVLGGGQVKQYCSFDHCFTSTINILYDSIYVLDFEGR